MRILCVDAGGLRIKSSLWVNGVREGDLVSRAALPDPQALLAELASIWAMHAPDAWAVSLPGITRELRYWSMSGAYRIGRTEIDVTQALGEHGAPAPDWICNDALAAAHGETRALDGRYSRAAVLNIGSGVGGGVVIDGRVQPAMAQEIGHIAGEGDYPCRCGRVGCVEPMVGWKDLSAQTGFSEPAEMRAAYDRGDVRSRGFVERADAAVARICAYLGTVLMPRYLIITGGTAQALYGDGGIRRLVAPIADMMLVNPGYPMEVRLGEGDEAVSRGLFELGRDHCRWDTGEPHR